MRFNSYTKRTTIAIGMAVVVLLAFSLGGYVWARNLFGTGLLSASGGQSNRVDAGTWRATPIAPSWKWVAVNRWFVGWFSAYRADGIGRGDLWDARGLAVSGAANKLSRVAVPPQGVWLSDETARETQRAAGCQTLALGWPFRSFRSTFLWGTAAEHEKGALWERVEEGVSLASWDVPTGLKVIGIDDAQMPRDSAPTRVLWWGLLANLVIYIAAVSLLLWVPDMFRLIRSRLRVRGGCCSACGYTLSGITTQKCPECGTAFGLRRGL